MRHLIHPTSVLVALVCSASVAPLQARGDLDDVRSSARAGEWTVEETPDSLNRLARRELNNGNYRRAAILFRQLRNDYRDSRYTPDTYYWEAFARYRTGESNELREAMDLLNEQARRYPQAATGADARTLAVQIRSRLAERGDASAAQDIAEGAQQGDECPRDDDDVRIMALNALMNMNADNALPILRQVLERRDDCWAVMRGKAVFLVSQKRSTEATDILLDVARNDPDREVQANAVFWLSQVRDERAVAALDSILIESDDREIQEKALFALSQHRSSRASEILRRYVERTDVPDDLRENGIFWLGQSNSEENAQFLRDLYARVDSRALKEKIIFSISQQRGEDAGQFLLDIALNENEDVELRKNALFWAGQKKQLPVESFARLYESIGDRELKESIIFALSQRNEREAVDVLMQIARTEADTELQTKAIFWLGQSKDPRVPQFLLEIINR